MERDPAGGRVFTGSSEESRRQAEQAFGLPPTRRRRPSLRRFAPLLALVVFVGAGVAGVIALAGAIDEEEEATRSPTLPSRRTVPSPAPPERRQPQRARTLFSAPGFRGALATARRLAGSGAEVLTLQLTAQRATFVVRADFRQKVILVSPGFTRTISTGGPDSPTGREFPFAALDARAPARMLAGIRRRYGVRPRAIDSLAALRGPADGVIWLANRRGGRGSFRGDAGGRSVERVG